MDKGAWQATVHEVTKSRRRLNDFHCHFHFFLLSLSTFHKSYQGQHLEPHCKCHRETYSSEKTCNSSTHNSPPPKKKNKKPTCCRKKCFPLWKRKLRRKKMGRDRLISTDSTHFLSVRKRFTKAATFERNRWFFASTPRPPPQICISSLFSWPPQPSALF